MVFQDPENMILFFRQKIKDNLSQRNHENMIFSLYLVKMVFLSPKNIISPFCHKSKDDLLPKKHA